jgi:hypothetical protein
MLIPLLFRRFRGRVAEQVPGDIQMLTVEAIEIRAFLALADVFDGKLVVTDRLSEQTHADFEQLNPSLDDAERGVQTLEYRGPVWA